MGTDQKILTWVRSFFCCSGWVFNLWVWKNFPEKYQILQFFPFWVQKKYHRVGSKNTRVKPMSASYLLHVKSMLGSHLTVKSIFLLPAFWQYRHSFLRRWAMAEPKHTCDPH